MNMKLTRLEDLLGGPSDPRGFGHNIISKKIRLMRKKCLVRLRNGRIFYSSPSLKMLKKCIGLTFQRRKWLLCVVWLCFFVLHTLQISYYITKTYLGCNQCVKKFQVALKSKIHFQKTQHVRIFYSSPSLKMLKKCIGLTFQRRKWLLCVVWLCFFVLHTLQISYHIAKTYLGCNQCVKKILGGCKIENSLSKVEKCQNILLITKLENVEKMHWAHVLEAQMASMCLIALLFCSLHSSDMVLLYTNLFEW